MSHFALALTEIRADVHCGERVCGTAGGPWTVCVDRDDCDRRPWPIACPSLLLFRAAWSPDPYTRHVIRKTVVQAAVRNLCCRRHICVIYRVPAEGRVGIRSRPSFLQTRGRGIPYNYGPRRKVQDSVLVTRFELFL